MVPSSSTECSSCPDDDCSIQSKRRQVISELKLVTDNVNHSNGRRLLYYQAIAVKPQNIEKKSIFMFISKNIYAKVVIFLLLLDVILQFLATYIMDLNVY